MLFQTCVTAMRRRGGLGWLLLGVSTACSPTTGARAAHPAPYAIRASPGVEINWLNIKSGRSEPPMFIDGSFLVESDALVSLVASVYSSFPAAARARRRHPVRIVPRQTLSVQYDNPVTLYNGFVMEIMLNTEPSLWSQFAYQLSHELCHVIINSPAIDNLTSWYEHLQLTSRWLEEMLCELASFYVLPRIAREWADEPPFRSARSYADNFRSYIEVERANAEQLPLGMSFVEWMHIHEVYLRQHPHDRAKNATVALQMLPLFETRPGLWTCVTYLEVNATRAEREQLDLLLYGWRAKSPDSCGEDITTFASVLGVTLN
jgi:hypothetical protein